MNSVLIRDSAPTATRQPILLHKRRLNLVRRHIGTPQTREHLHAHRPAGNPKPQHRVALAPDPVLVVGHRAGLRRGLEDDVAVAERDGDEGRLALGGRQGEQAGAEGRAEGPDCVGCEGAEGVGFACFLGDERRWLFHWSTGGWELVCCGKNGTIMGNMDRKGAGTYVRAGGGEGHDRTDTW